MPIKIRHYKESDASRVEDIYNSSRMDEFIGSIGHFHLVRWAEDKYVQNEFPNAKVYVCELEEVVGFCGYTNNHIHWLFVAPEARGNGIASSLLEHVIAKIDGEVTLAVSTFNLPANKLYRKLGFKIEREFDADVQDQKISVRRLRLQR